MNPTRPDAHPGSFKVNLDTGKWADFATGDNGGDLVTLYAYLYKLTHSEAARLLATELGVADYDHSPRRARSSKADWTPITPVPDNATPPPDLADGHLPQTLPAGGRAAPRAPAMRREREAENVRREAAAREKAVAIWQAAMTAPVDHPYLVKKGIKTHGLRVHDGALVIPMRDGEELHSLQFIGPDSDKRFLRWSHERLLRPNWKTRWRAVHCGRLCDGREYP